MSFETPMNLYRVIVILRTAALGAAVLLACVGCSSSRSYGLSEVPVAAAADARPALLPRPVVLARESVPAVAPRAAPRAPSVQAALQAVLTSASYPEPPVLPAPAGACGAAG